MLHCGVCGMSLSSGIGDMNDMQRGQNRKKTGKENAIVLSGKNEQMVHIFFKYFQTMLSVYNISPNKYKCSIFQFKQT